MIRLGSGGCVVLEAPTYSIDELHGAEVAN